MTVKKCKNACHPEALAEGSLTRFDRDSSVVALPQNDCNVALERDSSQTSFTQNDCKKKKAGFTLAEGTTYVDTPPILAKVGFTLAEVLITLGIIGVVAAMTIPNLIFSYSEAVTVTKVKKMNSVLANALKLSIEENGEVDGWPYENVGGNVNSAKNSQMLAKNIIPHLKVLQDCGFKKDCMLDVDYYMLNGTKWNTFTNYREKIYYGIILIDGSYLIVKAQGTSCNMKNGGYDNTCGYILYDINGNKKPNTFGRDVFEFEILPDTVVPKRNDGAGNDGDKIIDYGGTSAASYIIKNGNMRYLKNYKK